MHNLTGSIVALVTPMQAKSKNIDYIKFQELIAWHIEQGSDGIVVAGSTGEAATLTTDEWVNLLEIAKKTANNKVPIIAGTGSNSTTTSIEKTLMAEQIKVSAALIVTPYYNKPTQEGLKLHYKAIAETTSLPIILYNVPSRTGCDLLPTTVAELSKIHNIVGIKEATGKLERVNILRNSCKENFMLLSGDDASFIDFMLLGGDGVISVTANICPTIMHKLCNLLINNHKLYNDQSFINKIKKVNNQLNDLHNILMIESNPIPVKWLLAYLGKIEEAYRLPLTCLSTEHHAKVIAAYQNTINLSFEVTKEVTLDERS